MKSITGLRFQAADDRALEALPHLVAMPEPPVAATGRRGGGAAAALALWFLVNCRRQANMPADTNVE